MNDVPGGAYPFTTIDPSVGEAYVRVDCAAPEFGETCTPSVGYCDDGTRFVPTKLVDIAGLIPGAHEGDGLLHGIDCRSSRQIGGDHELDDGDVIELVTTT
jgi:ribosome-binding ATPase YchF (GTP1/OBG family)